jgi:hypothetical protein
MRLGVHNMDECRGYDVFFCGRSLGDHVITADDEAGEVEVMITAADGLPIYYPDGSMATARLRGSVVILPARKQAIGFFGQGTP